MEPVFMVLGQSAATAAVQAIEQRVAIQDIEPAKLKERLLADKQMLDFESAPIQVKAVFTKEKLGGTVVDDAEAKLTGFDGHGTTAAPFLGIGYAHDGDADKGTQKAVFKTVLMESGTYEIRIGYSALSNRASNVPVTIRSADGEKTVTLNQKKPGMIDGYLEPIGVFRFEAGKDAEVEISNEGTDGHVIVDAVQWLKQ
jgi:hypothetical protein